MADHGVSEYAVATGNDYAAHEETYVRFLAFAKWGTITIVCVLILMAIFLL
jgi:hypothetical protein